MAHSALSPRPLTQAALDLSPRALPLALIAALLLAGAWVAPYPAAALGLAATGAVFVALLVLVRVIAARHRRAEAAMQGFLDEFIAHDATPSVSTDADGQILHLNAAARERFGAGDSATLVALLGDHVAAPAAMIYRLQNRAGAVGAAQEDLAVRGGGIRLSVHRIGARGFLWRISDIGGPGAAGRGGDAISLPMMAVSRAGTILYMNDALRRLLGGRETTIERVITDLPLRPGEVHHVAASDGAKRFLLHQSDLSAGRREIYLLPPPEHRAVDADEWGLVEALPVPLVRLDSTGCIRSANRRARALLLTEPAGEHLSDLVEGLGRPVSDWLREAWTGRNLGRAETVRATRADERFLQISLEQIRDEDGPAVIAVLNDATAFKSLETQFVQSQKMQAIGQLAGGVAHDFNNLLTAISGHCDLLLLRHDRDDPDFGDLTQISQNTNRAAALVGQLLAFSRKQTLRPEQLDLAGTMGDLTHLLGRLVGEKVQVDFVTDPEIMPVRADKRQLEQVVMNLVVNARDALGGAGRIRLALNNVFLDTPLKRDQAVVPAGEYVTIRVIDEGEGIAPEHLRKIFEPFFTTKRAGKGTGLGLSMAYGIVKQSGGFIFADSVMGSGTTFTLYLPVSRAGEMRAATSTPDMAEVAELVASVPEYAVIEADTGDPLGDASIDFDDPGEADLPAPTHIPAAAAGGNVLLVEDEAAVRAFAARALKIRGFNVIEADSAEAALAKLEDPDLRIDVFVTDVVMPGMDGPTWVTEALRSRPGVKVVFVSGYSEDAVSEQQARIPNSVFLPKPFSLSELTQTVSRQLH